MTTHSAPSIITFPVAIAEMRAPTHPRLGTVRSPPADPRRLAAAVLSRVRRAPPPVEDDTLDTVIYLAFAVVFAVAIC